MYCQRGVYCVSVCIACMGRGGGGGVGVGVASVAGTDRGEKWGEGGGLLVDRGGGSRWFR